MCQNLKHWTDQPSFFSFLFCFLAAMLTDITDFETFYTTFNNSDLGWGSQGHWKIAPVDFTFQLISMEIGGGEAIQFQHPYTVFESDLLNQ